MNDDPLQSVYAYVERAYLRLQAGDLLTRCLEESSVSPVQQLVEGLVLAGPQSLQALREALAEARQRKVQVQDDLNQLYQNLEKSLNSYGVRLGSEALPLVLQQTPDQFLTLLKGLPVTDAEMQSTCLQIFRDSQDLVENLASRIVLLGEVELYLQDWLLGVAYQTLGVVLGGFAAQNNPQTTVYN